MFISQKSHMPSLSQLSGSGHGQLLTRVKQFDILHVM